MPILILQRGLIASLAQVTITLSISGETHGASTALKKFSQREFVNNVIMVKGTESSDGDGGLGRRCRISVARR
jgi:hypothetical protein